MHTKESYKRYHIETKKTLNIVPHPNRFKVKVSKLGLAKLILKELLHYRGNLKVVASRPCVYGVFSGPVGGFAPIEHLCVGCLRCTTQYPDICTILPNPQRAQLGDEFFKSDYVNTIVQEAESGRIPIKGQGYRGIFGGTEWDGMWTDMSEIVRPTRDGIHGREYISTETDIGKKPEYVAFNDKGQCIHELENILSIPIPILFDTLPSSLLSNKTACQILIESARQLQTFAILPLEPIIKFSLKSHSLIPLLKPDDYESFKTLSLNALLIEMSGWDERLYNNICRDFPHTLPILRTDFESDLLSYYQAGIRIFHLTANYHGRGQSGQFVLEMIQAAHQKFVDAKCRDQITVIGSGGIVTAEHVPKAIICGLDAVALDTSIMAALQAKFINNCLSNNESHFELPKNLTVEWGVQRLKNKVGAWRDQLLEIMGAMGLREVRRLRGEIGRAMFQIDLENDAFKGIAGYEER